MLAMGTWSIAISIVALLVSCIIIWAVCAASGGG